ncbi:MAG: glycoside hydrolase family 30 beta sandwich domain-containing protein [Gammaproteobacteria bacterium]
MVKLLCVVFIAVSLATAAPGLPEAEVTVAVDATRQHQTIEGFGATHVSLVYPGRGDNLSPPLRRRAIEAVYREVGISLGNLTGVLDPARAGSAIVLETPGSWEQRRNDNSDPFTFNWNGFLTTMVDNTKTKLVDLAQPMGFNNYYLGQQLNTRWVSPWLRELRSTDYERYLDEAAEQFLAGHLYLRSTYGIATKYQMPFNEPSIELDRASVGDAVNLVKRLGARLRREGFDPKFIVPNEESEEQSLLTAQAILSDPEARQYVGAIGYHPYPYRSVYASVPRILGTSGAGRPDHSKIAVRRQLRDLARQHGLPLWMTEVSNGGVDPRSFDDLRGRAIHIHDELVYAEASAYFGMLNMSDAVTDRLHYQGRGETTNFFRSTSEGTPVLIENDTGRVTITGMGSAIGHYARWLTPGAVRVAAQSSDPLVLVTAFRDKNQNRFVLVLINNGPAARQIQITVSGLKLRGDVVGERSVPHAIWQSLKPPSSAGNSLILNVPGESVTTLAATVF